MEFLRRRIGLIVRALISLWAIVWLVRNIPWSTVWLDAKTMDVRWLVAAFFAFMPILFVVSWRWRMLLGVHGVHLKYWRVFELNMIGQFFSAIGVGTTGGDVFKIFYVAKAVPQRRAAVSFTVVADRVIGLVALLFLGVLLSCTQLPLLLSQRGTREATATFYFFALGGLVACIGGSLGPYLLQRPAIRELLQRLPFMHRGTSLIAAYDKTARALGTNIIALLGSLPSHMCSILMGVCVLHAMHLNPQPPLLPFCAMFVMVSMLIALPISIGGVGVRETLFVLFFGLLHVDEGHAVAFSITFFALNLLVSLAACPFYFLYRHETHTPAPDVSPLDPLLSQQ